MQITQLPEVARLNSCIPLQYHEHFLHELERWLTALGALNKERNSGYVLSTSSSGKRGIRHGQQGYYSCVPCLNEVPLG